jgi:CheY-like chemotaxis protein
MNIFYIDDDAEDAFILKEALMYIDRSIHFVAFNDSVEGILFLMRTLALPDFIFLDVNMPAMNGKECLIKIKSQERLKDIPVIMLSTTCKSQEITELFDLGIYKFLKKPTGMENFFEALKSIIYSKTTR